MSEAFIPPVPEPLLGPLLETASEVLRVFPGEEVPPSLRPLQGFHARGMARGTARQQLKTAMESDEGFRGSVVDAFLDRSEVSAALAGWSAGEAQSRIDEAAARSDLPLLTSALLAARPAGWMFGLGLAAATFERARLVDESDAARQAIEARVVQSDEALRRADEARSAAEGRLRSVERELREERGARRVRDEQTQRAVEAAERQVQDVLAEGERLQREAEAATVREQRMGQKLRVVEGELRAARDTPTGPEITLRDRDLQALVDASELADRLAKGLGGVADRVRLLRASTPPPSSRRERRAGFRVPAGLPDDVPKAVEAMLRTQGAVAVIDGYNVTKRAWPELALSEQRDRLVSALAAVHARTHCDVTVVFDGADVGPVPAERRPGVRVRFSAANEEADAVVVREVAALPLSVPVVVVSSDREVRDQAEAEGATVVSSDTFLATMRA